MTASLRARTAPARTAPARPGLLAVTALLGSLLLAPGWLAGCAPAGGHASDASPAPAVTAPLATSMTTAGGEAWAIVAMGGSAADESLFWELFTRLPGSDQWALVTPSGVADNGGLVASGSSGPLTVLFRPSQKLTFSPLASTSDGGKTWGTGLLNASVASVPDALAANGATMLALLDDGAIDEASGSHADWRLLAAPGAIAGTAAGRRCQVTGWTGVAYTPSGTPLAAASCARPGTAGIFAQVAGAWLVSGPADPGGQPVAVIRLTETPAGDTALLRAGASGSAGLRAAWTANGTQWSASAALPLHGAEVRASGTGPGGALWALLSDGRAETLAGPGATWRELPVPPQGTAALAAGPDGVYDALVVSAATLTIDQVTSDGRAWHKAQAIKVPIQYGSSS
jgi:hypothetical protein